MAKRIARRALSIGLADVVSEAAKAKNVLSGLGGIEDWLRKALSISGACDHKDWLLATANKAIDDLLAKVPVPKFLKTVVAKAAKAQIKAVVDRACLSGQL